MAEQGSGGVLLVETPRGIEHGLSDHILASGSHIARRLRDALADLWSPCCQGMQISRLAAPLVRANINDCKILDID